MCERVAEALGGLVRVARSELPTSLSRSRTKRLTISCLV